MAPPPFGIHRILESKSDSAVEKILHGCLREKMQPNLASYEDCIHSLSRERLHPQSKGRLLARLTLANVPVTPSPARTPALAPGGRRRPAGRRGGHLHSRRRSGPAGRRRLDE